MFATHYHSLVEDWGQHSEVGTPCFWFALSLCSVYKGLQQVDPKTPAAAVVDDLRLQLVGRQRENHACDGYRSGAFRQTAQRSIPSLFSV